MKADKNEINCSLPKRRINRILYYSINDRDELKNKWNKWKNLKDTPEMLPKSKLKRFVYYSIFDRNKIKEKLFKN